MKTVFNFICLRTATAAVAALVTTGALAHAGVPGPVERLAALVDYVAADYPGAVRGGKILVESELAEQEAMLAEGQSLVRRLPPARAAAAEALARELDALTALVHAHAREDQVATACRAVHRRLLDDYGLVLAPLAPPSAERARALFALACASCHGKDGRADTPEARRLTPPPVSFYDAERMARISPQLAFHALTFGVKGTGMASFDSLPASDRWSLAFQVVALRHEAEDHNGGREAFARAGADVVPTASRLAGLSDAQLDELLQAKLPDAAERARALAWLRLDASFAVQPGGTFAEARRLLTELAAVAGDRPRAHELAILAYLEGIEPHEAVLRARDRDVAARVEKAFFDLRQTIDRGAGADDVRREVARATLVLDGAEERGRGGASVSFFAALAIALREGFEISLLVAALLAFVRRNERARLAAATAAGQGGRAQEESGALERFIHAGWLLAIPAGLLTWFLVGAALRGARRELTEGVLTLLAAAMLLFVSHFVLGRLESRRWLKFLETRIASAQARGWALLLVAFTAAYREAIEIVLFFRALALDAPGRGWAIAGGAAAGLLGLVVLVKVMSILGRRLSPRPLLLVSSFVLAAVAVSLVGQGMRALQEGGYLALTPLPFHLPQVTTIGLYPTVQGVAAQLALVLLVALPVLARRRAA